MAAKATGTVKRKYEKPVLCPLGELAKGAGQSCNPNGTNATGAVCNQGLSAKNCKVGSADI